MRTVLNYLRTSSAALRLLLVLTVLVGVIYPLVITAIGQIPGLKSRADGSLIRRDGAVVGSSLIGQEFTDGTGNPLPQYFQSRPSAAGAGYDPTASSASNLGPESIVDTLPDPSVKGDTGTQSLLTQVCTRSLAIGRRYGVSGARPFCSPDGTGSVLAVFWSEPDYRGHVVRVVSVNQGPGSTPFQATYRGVRVQLMRYGQDVAAAQIVPVRGDAPGRPAVPADAVTASGSGLDPDISVSYARLQAPSVARTRGLAVSAVDALIRRYTTARTLSFMGEPAVDVVQLNLALDRKHAYRAN